MSSQIPRRRVLLGGAVSAFAFTPSRTAQADTTFANFAFAATGAPTARTMPDRLADVINVKDWGQSETTPRLILLQFRMPLIIAFNRPMPMAIPNSRAAKYSFHQDHIISAAVAWLCNRLPRMHPSCSLGLAGKPPVALVETLMGL